MTQWPLEAPGLHPICFKFSGKWELPFPRIESYGLWLAQCGSREHSWLCSCDWGMHRGLTRPGKCTHPWDQVYTQIHLTHGMENGWGWFPRNNWGALIRRCPHEAFYSSPFIILYRNDPPSARSSSIKSIHYLSGQLVPSGDHRNQQKILIHVEMKS